MNQRVIELLNEWKSEGSPQQGGFDWTRARKNWEKAFPDHKPFIASLPNELNRGHLRSICESSENTIIEKFLVVMIWGYGDRGYGPYRVTQMLSTEHAEKVLFEVHSLCSTGKPKDAYEFLRKNRLRILGPAYGTKFITFCTPRETGAPIYDSYVGMWIEKFAPQDFTQVPTASITWNQRTYSRYSRWIKEHSDHFGCYPDEVELVLFRDAQKAFAKNSNWGDK